MRTNAGGANGWSAIDCEDEHGQLIRAYVLACCRGDQGDATCSQFQRAGPRQRRKPPRTHLQAELVRRRRNPEPSPKTDVQDALQALTKGDVGAVEALLLREGATPVSDEWQQRYKHEGQLYWDHFYSEKTINFFKDRNYLREEFGEIMPPEILEDPRRWVEPMSVSPGEGLESPRSAQAAAEGRPVLLELGCAVGNGVLPMLRFNPNLFAYACDLSPVAISLLKQKEEYQCGRCLAFPCDVTRGEEQPTPMHSAIERVIPPQTVDFATLLFVLSAIDPSLHRCVLARIHSRLRPGGMLLVRDYGRGDLAQVRFSAGHWLGGDLYVRSDGTLAHFQTTEGLTAELAAVGFDEVECQYHRRDIVNRGTGVTMPRVWVQGKFLRR